MWSLVMLVPHSQSDQAQTLKTVEIGGAVSAIKNVTYLRKTPSGPDLTAALHTMQDHVGREV